MALPAGKKKGILLFSLGGATIGGTCCGLSFVPWGGSGSNGPKTLRYGSWYPRFVLGSTEGEDNGGIKMPRELYVEANNSLIQNGSDKEISFDNVTMKLGIKTLSAGDVFFKVSEGNREEGYYFAQHIWDTQFRLDNGERKSWTELTNGNVKPSENGNGRGKAKTIKLKFKNGTGTAGGGNNGKIIIRVGSCTFKLNKAEGKPQKWTNLEMKCKSVNGNNGNGEITLLGEHQHYYVYTVTK